MYFTTTDNKKMYYEVHGNQESEKAIIFLNGLSQSTVAWFMTVPAFNKDYKVVLCDLVFQGQSDKAGEYRNFDQHAQDVCDLVDSLGINKINVVGISYGSLVAQHMALNHPEKVNKIVLMATFANSTAYTDAIGSAWSLALDSGGYDLMFDIMLPTVLSENYFLQPLIPIETLKKAKQELNTDAKALKKLMTATENRGDYRGKLGAIKCPTLIIQGDKDVLFPVHMAEEVRDAIPGSKLEVIRGVGHTLNLEAIPQTVQLMLSFFK